MKKVILFGYLFWAILVALFIITFPDGINSLGWAIYGGGFLLGYFLLITTITLIYYSTKYKTVKIFSLILGVVFCSADELRMTRLGIRKYIGAFCKTPLQCN